VPPDRADALVRALRDAGLAAATVIGEITAEPGRLVIE